MEYMSQIACFVLRCNMLGGQTSYTYLYRYISTYIVLYQYIYSVAVTGHHNNLILIQSTNDQHVHIFKNLTVIYDEINVECYIFICLKANGISLRSVMVWCCTHKRLSTQTKVVCCSFCFFTDE